MMKGVKLTPQQLNSVAETHSHYEHFCAAITQVRPESELLLCGGVVRDLLLDRPFGDIDLLLPESEHPGALADHLQQVAGGAAYPLHFDYLSLIRWHFERDWDGARDWNLGGHIDLLMLPDSRSGIYDRDSRLASGDYTINCLGADVRTGEIYDPLGGLQHLNERVLHPGAPGPGWEGLGGLARAMRGLKYMALLDLTPSPEAKRQILRSLRDVSASLIQRHERLIAHHLRGCGASAPGFSQAIELICDPQVPPLVQIKLNKMMGADLPAPEEIVSVDTGASELRP